MSFRVYVAAPHADAAHVRSVHDLLRYLRLEPTSAWAEKAIGREDLEAMPIEAVRRLAAQNDDDLTTSDAVLVLPRDDAGREMYAEARLAIERGIPVVWVSEPRCLSAYRQGVDRVEDMTAAYARLCELAAQKDSGPTTIRNIIAPSHEAAS